MRPRTFMMQLVPAFLLLLASGTTAKACIQPSALGFWWNECAGISIYLDPSLNNLAPGPGTTPVVQIQNAINAWYYDLSGLNIPISIAYQSGNPAVSNIIIQAAPLDNPSTGASQPGQSGAITQQTITINSTFSYADPTQSAYQTLYFKIILHELGHVFGMADVYNNCVASQSVMDQVCGVDDAGQGIALAMTTCDNAEVSTIYQTNYPCGCAGCGGGGPPSCGDAEPCDDDDYCDGGYCDNGCCVGNEEVVLDVNGTGYQLTNASKGVTFDMTGRGEPAQMSWSAGQSRVGFLGLDRNHNGKIDNGTELFTNLTPPPGARANTKPRSGHAFEPLAAYDRPENGGNGDGWIDASDSVYNQLVVWIDDNHNGVSDPGELHTLADLGITRISLNFVPAKWDDAFGNHFLFSSEFVTNEGVTRSINSVSLRTK